MEHYKLYIFDWDGTLMDSIGRIVSSLQCAAIEQQLVPPSDREAKSIIGLSLAPALKQLFPQLSAAQEASYIKAYKQQFLYDNNVAAPLFEHSIKMLNTLKQQNKLLAVATGKARAGLNKMLVETNTAHFFDKTICADESESKPSPNMLNQILNALNIDVKEAVMVGDSIHDLKMANNAGMDSVAITLGADTKERLVAYEPNVIVDSISELTQLLTGSRVHSN